MNERWKRIGALFDEALAASPETRDALIDAHTEEPAVKQEVRALLAAHASAGDFLNTAVPASSNDDAPAAGHAEELAPGTRLGPYHIDGVLGRGGMGVVYAAEDTRLRRRVALKALPRLLSADDRQRRRLRHEARAAATLQHPGIATVYALEEFEGDLYIASEYLDGETLRTQVTRGRLSAEAAVSTMTELLRALTAAHERGVVHRDLKPENVIRTHDGTLKILDFGLATVDAAHDDLASRTQLTQRGLVAGTPLYMAPEQLLGRPSDFRVDHFAVGVMLYELCTGRHPFGGGSLPTTIARILADAPDLAMAAEGGALSPALQRVITRCRQKDTRDRFATTRELAEAVAAASPRAIERHADTPAPAGDSPPVASRLDPNGLVPAGAEPDASASTFKAARGALQWWRFHQVVAAVLYWAMIWPAWHVHRSFGRAGLSFFFAVLAAAVVAGTLRLHLWFSSRVYPEDLPAHKPRVSRWVWSGDVALVVLLIGGGIALPEPLSGWAALLISFGVGAAVAFTVIEPATAQAAFRDWNRRE